MNKKLGILFTSIFFMLSLCVNVKADVKSGDLGLGGNPVLDANEVPVSSVSVTTGNYTGTGEELNPGEILIRKTVSKTPILGKYQVQFYIEGKDVEITNTNPVYIVVVLDKSNSMADNSKWTNAVKAAKQFAKNLVGTNNTNTHLALATFNGGKTNDKNGNSGDAAYNDARTLRRFGNGDTRDFDNITFGTCDDDQMGGTNLGAGLYQANKIFEEATIPEDALKFVVIMSDGAPTYRYITTGWNKGLTEGTGNSDSNGSNKAYAVSQANVLKAKEITIFSVGYDIKNNTSAQQVLKDISTDNAHYVNADSIDSITSAFSGISEIIKSAGQSGTITDGIGTNFVITDGKRTIELPVGTINEEGYTTDTFDIYIDPSVEEGWHYTNSGFSLSYLDADGEEQVIESPQEAQPQVYWARINHNVEKVWEDKNATSRPASIKVKLFADGVEIFKDDEDKQEITLSSDNEWKYTFENLVEYKRVNGELVKISYDVKEEAVPGYIVSYQTNGNLTTITNTKTTLIKVLKKWENMAIFGDTRPNVRVKLFYKETENDSWKELSEVTLSNANNWQHEWNTIDKFGKLPEKYIYKVEEVGFTGIENADYLFKELFIKKTTNNGNNFTITNTCKASYELPETGSSKMLFTILASISFIGVPIIFSLYKFTRKYI